MDVGVDIGRVKVQSNAMQVAARTGPRRISCNLRSMKTTIASLLLCFCFANQLCAQAELPCGFPYWKAQSEPEFPDEKRKGSYRFYNALKELIREEEWKKNKLISTTVHHPKANYYDANKRLIEHHRYDAYGFLTDGTDWLRPSDELECIDKYVYSEAGLLLEEQHYNQRQELVQQGMEPAITRYTYNAAGKLVEQAYLDHNRERMNDALGLSYLVYSYDAQGNKIREEAFTKSGSRSYGFEGASISTYRYDAHGNVLEQRLLSPDSQLIPMYRMGAVAIKRYRYNNKQQKVYMAGWVNDELKLGDVRFVYDSTGQLARKQWYHPADSSYMEHESVFTRNADGVAIHRASLSQDGDTLSQAQSAIVVEIPGWSAVELPNIASATSASGSAEFLIRLNAQGQLQCYEKTSRDEDKAFLDFCRDALNHMTFEANGRQWELQGTARFRRIPNL